MRLQRPSAKITRPNRDGGAAEGRHEGGEGRVWFGSVRFGSVRVEGSFVLAAEEGRRWEEEGTGVYPFGAS